jgi:hypothetical protein
MIADNAYEKFGQQIALLKIFCEDFAFKKSQRKLSSFKINTGFLRTVVTFFKRSDHKLKY